MRKGVSPANWMIEEAQKLAKRMLVPRGGTVLVDVERSHEQHHVKISLSHHFFTHLSPPPTIMHEITVSVLPQHMQQAEERLDAFRDELRTLARWDRVNFGVCLEEIE
jgi:hypothetical protein